MCILIGIVGVFLALSVAAAVPGDPGGARRAVASETARALDGCCTPIAR